MEMRVVAVDLAKDVFEIAWTTAVGQVEGRRRVTRPQFERFLRELPAGTDVVMEACSSAHHWGRYCQQIGLIPILLPTQYVRPYVRRNKSDRTDAEALLEARRCRAIRCVPVETADQQALQSLHRVRTQWQAARTARLNVIRGLLREYGLTLRAGAGTVRRVVPGLLADASTAIPERLRPVLHSLLEEVTDLERRVGEIDRQLSQLAEEDPIARRLQTVPGVGVIVATGLLGSVPHIHSFRRGRQFASWLGLTPREASSGMRRWSGGISKRGDVYLRCVLTHGARSVLFNAATARPRAPRPPDPDPTVGRRAGRATRLQQSRQCAGHKLARIIWAVWHRDVDFSVTTPAAA
jgi:transposase